MNAAGDEARVHLLGIRHHGPGSAALVRQALEELNPACVLIEGPPEGNDLIRFVNASGMKPPVALLIHGVDDVNEAVFMPFAEFSPEWQALCWALETGRAVSFCDWPAAHSLAFAKDTREQAGEPVAVPAEECDPDPLDMMAIAAGYGDGEAFWNTLIEQYGRHRGDALDLFRAIEEAMTEARLVEQLDERGHRRQQLREAFMRTHLRSALKEHSGPIAVVCGAWHTSALRHGEGAGEDRALIKGLPKIKVQATWVPWTDSRLSAASGYGAGVISPGWYQHLWRLYNSEELPNAEAFAAIWQAQSAALLRNEGYAAPTANAIEAARLALGLAAMRGLSVPGLTEMRDATLAALCHGDPLPLMLLERKLYVGERVGEIGDDVPQMPLARDLAAWQKKTRLKPEDVDTEVRLDLRSEAGLLRSTLLHRLSLLNVPWGRLVEAEAGRGTFREVWSLRWTPELSVSLAEALVYGITLEAAAGTRTRERAKSTTAIAELADLIRAALVAGLPEAATDCIADLQALAMRASDLTDLMQAIVPLVRVLRYGSARKLPDEALRLLVVSLSAEVNAGVRIASHALDDDIATRRVNAMQEYEEALRLFGDEAMMNSWRQQLAVVVEDARVTPAIAGLALRQLHNARSWQSAAVAAAFSRQMSGGEPQRAGSFLEGFLTGGSEILLHDHDLLQMVDTWLGELNEETFIQALPLLRRSLSDLDPVARRHLLERVRTLRSRQNPASPESQPAEDNPAFAAALPLLYQILGISTEVAR